MQQPPWNTNQLKKLGFSLRDATSAPGDVPSYDQVLLWYNELAVEVQLRIAAAGLESRLSGKPIEVTSRAKTIDTLTDKLQRDRATPLSSIQDVAGVRVEGDMTLDQQDELARGICELFDHDPDVSIRDSRSAPHSGYRAVHVWLRLPWRVEVQIRTHLQGEWANMYESAADVFGRMIRYDSLPVGNAEAGIVKALRDVSQKNIRDIENLRNEAERLRDTNVQVLRGLDYFDIEDTLPVHLAEALDVQTEIDERLARAAFAEREMRGGLVALKSMFESMVGKEG